MFAPVLLVACSCAGDMPQLLLDRAQLVAEVQARDGGEFQILRLVRGAPNARVLYPCAEIRAKKSG